MSSIDHISGLVSTQTWSDFTGALSPTSQPPIPSPAAPSLLLSCSLGCSEAKHMSSLQLPEPVPAPFSQHGQCY